MDRRNFGKKFLMSFGSWLLLKETRKTIVVDHEHKQMILEVKKELLRSNHLNGHDHLADQYLEPTHYERDPHDHLAFYIVNRHGQTLSFQRNAHGSVRFQISSLN